MGYAIDEVQGIGPTFKEKLNTAGITTTEKLLEMCATKNGRADIAGKTGFDESTLLKFTNMADMMRINGVGGQFAELLKATGVDTVKELKMRNAENLTKAMEELNGEKNLAKTNPALSQVEKWIEEAKTMDPMITH